MSQVPEANDVGTRFTSSELTRRLRIERALRGVGQLRQHALEIEAELAGPLQRTSPLCRESAYNLAHYLAVRQVDIRPLQRELSQLGLSSLGVIEAHVMASLNAVLQLLHALGQRPVPPELHQDPPITFEVGQAMLDRNTEVLFGPRPEGRRVRVMVTMPSEAADDSAIIPTLLAQGMDVMRINCAHDGPDVWTRMLQQLRAAEDRLGKSCRVSFDLAGPKLRTGPVAPGPEVLKWRPSRNQLGQVTAPAVICLSSEPNYDDVTGTVVPVNSPFTTLAAAGDEVRFRDARGHERLLNVVEAGESTCVCVTEQTAYVTSNLGIELRRGSETIAHAKIGKLPPAPQVILLSAGDPLRVVRDDASGRQAVLDDEDQVVEPAVVGCSVPEVFRDVRPGERIFFDDGKIAGVIREVSPDSLLVEIVSAAGGTAKLRSEKGINLPDTDLHLPALTDKDLKDLEFVARHGDMVALSFVQRPEDIEQLNCELKRQGRAAGDDSEDRNPAGVPESAPVAVDRDAAAARGHHGRPRRPGRGSRLRAAVGGAGRNPLGLRGRAPARHLGHAGPGVPGQRRPAIARRSNRCRHGQPRRMRDAEQGSVHPSRRTVSLRRSGADAGASREADRHAPPTEHRGSPTALAVRRSNGGAGATFRYATCRSGMRPVSSPGGHRTTVDCETSRHVVRHPALRFF